jgi:AcrR family transcriptional regulator
MPRRRQDAYAERRRQIIAGALQVFSTKGFIGATNKDIALAAGINSPGLIYHYFDSKEDLLRAVIEQHAPPMQLLAQADELMTLPPEQALVRIAQAYLRVMDDPKLGACMRVLIGEAMHSPEFGELLGMVGPLRVLGLIADYLQRKMDEGLLRPVEPTLAARCFLGPFVLHLLTQTVLDLPGSPEVDAASLTAAAVTIFLHGLQTGGRTPAAPKLRPTRARGISS